MSEELVTQQTAITPMSMLQMAVSQNADLDKLEKLMALQERWEANEARKAYISALADFKSDPLIINKDKHVEFQTSKGVTAYNHATLGNICNIIGAALAKHGLSYRWATEQNGKIKVTCTLMHSLGHSESVSLESSADESGGKNSIQAIGSAVSYLQRYTLLAITGTATQEQDDDGKGAFTTADVMPDDDLNGYVAAIETATTKGAIGNVYLRAIERASTIGDQVAMNRLNVAKNEALGRIAK